MTMPNTLITNLTHTMPSRSEVEDFLFHEAALLDEWRLDDWLGLLTEDASYRVPPNGTPQGDHRDTLFTVADDIRRIRARVTRLKDRNAHAEYPLSRTRRMIANVRLLPMTGALPDNELEVLSNYVVYRFRREERIREYVGQYRHRLRIVDGQLRIAARTVLIDAHELGSLGSVSFIL
jgi:p-cumate 2,3-dioxygenase beta subunit